MPDIDAILVGHSYQLLLDAKSTVSQPNLPDVDEMTDTVNSVPTVMANYWGKHLSVIKLGLVFNGTNWTMDKVQTTMEMRSVQNADKAYITASPTVPAAIATEHQTTTSYAETPADSIDFNMGAYFIDMDGPSAIGIVSRA